MEYTPYYLESVLPLRPLCPLLPPLPHPGQAEEGVGVGEEGGALRRGQPPLVQAGVEARLPTPSVQPTTLGGGVPTATRA